MSRQVSIQNGGPARNQLQSCGKLSGKSWVQASVLSFIIAFAKMLSIRRAALRALSATSSTSASLSRSTLRASFPKPSSLASPSSRISIPVALSFRSYSSSNDAPVREVDAATEIPSPFNDPANAVRSGFDAVRDAAGMRPPRRESRGDGARRPRDPAEPNPQVYLGNMLFETSEEAVREAFAPFGEIKNIRLITDPRGLRKGFGYVEYETTEAATAAIEGMNGQDLEGRRLAVQYASVRKPRERVERPAFEKGPATKTLFIGNLSYDMTDQDLNDLFSQTEDVLDVRVAMDRSTGKPRGFAHADFLTQDAADKAMSFLETQTLGGRKLRINYGRPVLAGERRQRRTETPEGQDE